MTSFPFFLLLARVCFVRLCNSRISSYSQLFCLQRCCEVFKRVWYIKRSFPSSLCELQKFVEIIVGVDGRDENSFSFLTGICPAKSPFRLDNYGSREGTIQKYFANPKKYFKSQYFSQITVEKFDKSKKLLEILRKFVDPQITFSIIRKYFVNP